MALFQVQNGTHSEDKLVPLETLLAPVTEAIGEGIVSYGQHDRLQASFIAGLRPSHRWRRVQLNDIGFCNVTKSVHVIKSDLASADPFCIGVKIRVK